MPRHMQPREVAEAKGAVKHDPQRYRNEVPKSAMPIGTAPAHMTPAAKACWFEIESYAPIKVLSGADRIAVEMLANLLVEFRDDPRGFTAPKLGQMIRLLASLGMTPSDRQKLGTEKPKDTKDGFDEF